MTTEQYRQAAVEALARCLAAADGKLSLLMLCMASHDAEEKLGHADGYASDAASLLDDLERCGFTIVRKEQK